MMKIEITLTNTKQLLGLEAALENYTDMEGERRKDGLGLRGREGGVVKFNEDWTATDEDRYQGALQTLKMIKGSK